MVCEICGQIQGAVKSFVVYEDEHTLAVLDQKGIHGQILLFPRIHLPILESIPDPLIMHLGNITTKLSVTLYKALELDGTNIIINNGVSAGQTQPHFSISIIPRKESDGLKFSWEQKEISVEKMDEIEEKIKAELKKTMEVPIEEKKEDGTVEQVMPAVPEEKTAADDASEEVTNSEDYQVKRLIRRP